MRVKWVGPGVGFSIGAGGRDRAGARSKGRKQLTKWGGWGGVRRQGQEARTDNKDRWGSGQERETGTACFSTRRAPSNSALKTKSQGNLKAPSRSLSLLYWAEAKAYPCCRQPRELYGISDSQAKLCRQEGPGSYRRAEV